MERLATEAEATAEQKDMKTVYQIAWKLRGDRGQNQDLTVKAKDGSIITEEMPNYRDGDNTLNNHSTVVTRLRLQTLVGQNKTWTSNMGPSLYRRSMLQ